MVYGRFDTKSFRYKLIRYKLKSFRDINKVDSIQVEYMKSIRTNNDVEGWHLRLNSQASGKSQVPFYLLVKLLQVKFIILVFELAVQFSCVLSIINQLIF